MKLADRLPGCTVWLLTWAAVCTAACGSTSTETATGPSPIKCAVTTSTSAGTFPASGGTGTITVSAGRECNWSAASQSAWIALSAPSDGRGDGSISYKVASNPDGTTRKGSLVINDRPVEVSQQGAPCRFSTDRESLDFAADGGSLDVEVRGPAGCPWTAGAEAPWVSLSASQGNGPGRVTVRAAVNAAAARETTITIAGVRVVVRQQQPGAPPPSPPPPSGDCTYTLSASDAPFTAAGGDGTVALATRAECGWTASSDAAWVSLRSDARGTGPATIAFRVAASSERQSRVAHLTIGSAVLTITQAGTATQCTYSLDPQSASVPALGGQQSFTVRTSAGCPWTAASHEAWISIVSGASGSGDGQVQLAVTPNALSSSRTGTVTAGGQTFTVTQAGTTVSCTYTLDPTSASFDASGGSGSFQVQTSKGCEWTASSQAGWISIDNGSSGSGNGTVQFSVASNGATSDRTGTITAGAQVFTVRQAGSAGQTVTLSGAVGQLSGTCPSLTFSVDSRVVRTTAQTAFKHGGCSKIDNGKVVTVTGLLQGDGSVVATEVDQ